MKLEVLTGSFGAAAGILLIAFSEAAMRSDGEAPRPDGRVPGSSGWSGGSSGAIATRGGAVCGSRISLMVLGSAGGGSAGAGTAGNEKVVDADFEEVDDQKKRGSA